jgi:hypothetical protein
MATVYRSTKPCFVCKKQEKTVLVRNGEVNVPLCLDHLYEQLIDKPKKVKPAKKAEKK